MQLRKITKFLFEKFPLEFKEEWDPCGWNVKFNLSEKFTGVVIAIDLTNEVLNKAIQTNSNLILTHHPFKFEETWETENIKAPYKTAILEKLKQHRINVLSFHTNYDNDKEGTSHQIAKHLGFWENRKQYEANYPCVLDVEISFNALVNIIKNVFGFKSMRTNLPIDSNKKIKKLAILSGSGYIAEVNKLTQDGYDLIITSDPKWSDWINYKEINAPILEIPHLDEQVFVDDLFTVLKQKFPTENINYVKLNEPYRNV
ncbi:Nif3-like dinuclear metal center hexameric protein [Mycoplasmopsis felifaucium]|uniref:GTP cyclohydrolase 1 type 2 homolog n=1 Tax=Mycoplasmopsis felifaucium TaxID=35768 RepID=A0ABZ2RQM9_9BACT